MAEQELNEVRKNSGVLSSGRQNTAPKTSSSSSSSGTATADEISNGFNMWFKPTFDGETQVFYSPSEWLRSHFTDTVITVYQYVGGTFWYNPDPDLGAGESYMNGDMVDYSSWTYDNRDYFGTTFSCANNTFYDYVIKQHVDGVEWVTWWSLVQYQRSLPTPSSINYNQGTNTLTFSSSSSRKVVEFKRVDGANPYGYAEDTLELFYAAACMSGESGIFDATWNNELKRWGSGNHTVRLSFFSSTPTDRRTQITSVLQDYLSDLNPIIAPSGASFSYTTAGTADITVEVGNHQELWGWTPAPGEQQFGGSWENLDTNGLIYSGLVKVRYDEENLFFTDIPSIIYEEMTEVLGPGNDSWEHYDTIFSEYSYQRKPDYFSQRDADVLRLLYNRGLPIGEQGYRIASMMNPPNGHYGTFGNSINLSFLQGGTSYYIRMWAADADGDFSAKSSYITITTPATPTRPQDFSWTYPKVSGQDVEVGADEWNAFTTRINQFREYKGLSNVTFTYVHFGDDIKAVIYNQARNALLPLSSYFTAGTLPSSVTNLTSAPTSDMYASHFTSLVTCMNSIL